jgi:hypothetical protein
MAYFGQVPGEHSSCPRRRQGSITLTGNAHARRMLVESAWSYHFPAGWTKHLRGKARNASPGARQIAGKALTRLCRRSVNPSLHCRLLSSIAIYNACSPALSYSPRHVSGGLIAHIGFS